MRKQIIFTFFAVLSAIVSNATNNLEAWQKAAIATRFASEVKYNFAGYGKFAQDYDNNELKRMKSL